MKFRLHPIFNGGIERIVMCSGKRPGTETNKRMTFLPDTIYSLNDPVAIQYIKGEIGDVREKRVATDGWKAELDYRKIPYTIKKCGTCANAKPKVFFNPFEILEDD